MLGDWIGSSREPVFPLVYPSDSPTHAVHHSGADQFPRHITGDLVVLKFNTKWVREDAGTSEMSPAFGYAVVSADGRQLAVYHLWGNS
jgi:hypothetical protein